MKIELKNITKKFPERDKKIKGDITAVSDFSFEFKDGNLTGLLGPSGCGKSTVLNMISGLIKPTEGRIFFDGEDVTDLPPEKRGVGMVFQSYALYPHMTVEENIMFPLGNLKGNEKMSKKEMKEEARKIASVVEIESLLKRKPKELSGGQQQRVAIARALVKNPKVLLLDEPLSNLDARLRLQTREEIKRIQKETNITAIFVTHDQEEAMSISDEVVLMEKGIINQWGKPQEIYDEPKNLFAAKFLGTPPINIFEAEIKDKVLYVGNEAIMEKDALDSEVLLGIRPEGFLIGDEGVLTLNIKGIEVMGKDVSVVASHELSRNQSVRAIIPAEKMGEFNKATVKFSLNEAKVFVFSKETGERM